MAPSVQWLLPVAGIKMPAPRQLIEGSVYRGSQSRMLQVHQSREARRLQAWWLEQEAGRSHLPLQTPSKEGITSPAKLWTLLLQWCGSSSRTVPPRPPQMASKLWTKGCHVSCVNIAHSNHQLVKRRPGRQETDRESEFSAPTQKARGREYTPANSTQGKWRTDAWSSLASQPEQVNEHQI